jgi:opacity protein-like surface antigen
MKTNIPSNRKTAASLLALGLLSCGTAALAADSFGRTGKVELSGGGQYLFGDRVTIPGYGVRLDIDNTFLGGIGVTYHFNDHLALGFDFGLGLTDVVSRGNEYLLNQDTVVVSGMVNLEYNVLSTPLTPMIQAGVGFMNWSDTVPEYQEYGCGIFTEGCSSTYSETNFSWKIGAGLRWDITDHFVMKLVGGVAWSELNGSDRPLQFGFLSLSIGGAF